MGFFIAYKFILAAVVFIIALGVAAYSTYGERKVAAFMQDRVGPDRAGPYGLLQPLADGVKMFMKEETTPAESNKFLFVLGPSLTMFTALMATIVIPWAGPLIIKGESLPMQLADVNIGILYSLGIVSIGVYGILIGGWASNSKYSLLGALRASSQMISYEIAMGLAIIALIMHSGTLSIGSIVEKQASLWNVFIQPLSFLIFIICAFAETNRAPFDLPECETELVGGYHTEYSSMKLGLYLFAEYINMFVSSALISCLYFGGYNLPFQQSFFIDTLGLRGVGLSLCQFGFLFGKIVFFIFFFMWIRWTIPRFRYDQLMRLGWKILLPLAILNIIITGLVMYFTGALN